MVQEVENQDICTVTGGTLTCGTTDNADGKPDDLQELALKIAANGGPTYDAALTAIVRICAALLLPSYIAQIAYNFCLCW